MKLVTPLQMNEIDQKASSEYGVPSLLLMEHAAYQVFSFLKEENLVTRSKERVVIVCGTGNNGGDGLALARQLLVWSKVALQILFVGTKEKLSQDGRTYYEIVEKMNGHICPITEENIDEVNHLLSSAHVIVDALLGTGLKREVVGVYREVIDAINKSDAYTVSVDLPSGISGETGKVQGVAVRADTTITFALPKVGLCLYPAIDYVGQLKVVEIGIPQALLEKIEVNHYTIEGEEMILPLRPTRSNKSTYGKILVIGGQRGMSGAPYMTSSAALKVGAGIVTALVPECIHDIMEQKLTEVMTMPLLDEEGHFAKGAAKQIASLIPNYDMIAIGPGIGRSTPIKELLVTVLGSDKPCLIDADGLYDLREMLALCRTREAPTILTPHPGEMARLTGLEVQEILDNPIAIARAFATKNKVILVLKLERTVIASPSGDIYINRGGNTGLAKGGSGDILAGMIAGFSAKQSEILEGVILGVYMHARAADLIANKKSQYSLLPTDLFEGIEEVFKELARSH